MTHKNKWLTRKEAYKLACEIAEKKQISIEKLAKIIGISHTTIYRWGNGSISLPDVRKTEILKELAIKEGIVIS